MPPRGKPKPGDNLVWPTGSKWKITDKWELWGKPKTPANKRSGFTRHGHCIEMKLAKAMATKKLHRGISILTDGEDAHWIGITAKDIQEVPSSQASAPLQDKPLVVWGTKKAFQDPDLCGVF